MWAVFCYNAFMKKIFILILLLAPFVVSAQGVPGEEIFKAQVVEVIEEKEIVDEYGVINQQNLKLIGLQGNFKDQEFVFTGIDNFHIVSTQVYKDGDRVVISYSKDLDGNDEFFILNYDRTNPILWLSVIFVVSVLMVGRWKGFRSLLALIVSFAVILKFIVPQILAGANPVLVSVFGGIVILFFAIYLTQGINRKAHIVNLSLAISLFLVALLSVWFTKLARLSGYAGEATEFLINTGQGGINLQGLLLAGIMIGTLGVLDDVIVSQVSTVEQLKMANPDLTNKQIYIRSLKVGIDHITSMINTLFFAYAGVSLSLLILFTQSDVVGLSLFQIMNDEIIATEIVRTLLGSVGIILSIPIANYLACYLLNPKLD